MAEEVIESFKSSLAELTFNSKPLINMLTMLAEDHEQYGAQIVQVIEDQLQQARPSQKLPMLYLIDSIIKNLTTSSYPQLFMPNIITTFCETFEKVDEKTRQAMFKLRQTWEEIFQNKKLYAIDVRIQRSDPAWPITAQPPEQGSIHVNPRFLVQKEEEEQREQNEKTSQEQQEALMRQQLISKQQELLKLQQQRLELELAETKHKLELQKKQAEIREHQLEEKLAEVTNFSNDVPQEMPVQSSSRPAPGILRPFAKAPGTVPNLVPGCSNKGQSSGNMHCAVPPSRTKPTMPLPSVSPAAATERGAVFVDKLKTPQRQSASSRDPRLATRDPRLASRDPRLINSSQQVKRGIEGKLPGQFANDKNSSQLKSNVTSRRIAEPKLLDVHPFSGQTGHSDKLDSTNRTRVPAPSGSGYESSNRMNQLVSNFMPPSSNVASQADSAGHSMGQKPNVRPELPGSKPGIAPNTGGSFSSPIIPGYPLPSASVHNSPNYPPNQSILDFVPKKSLGHDIKNVSSNPTQNLTSSAMSFSKQTPKNLSGSLGDSLVHTKTPLEQQNPNERGILVSKTEAPNSQSQSAVGSDKNSFLRKQIPRKNTSTSRNELPPSTASGTKMALSLSTSNQVEHGFLKTNAALRAASDDSMLKPSDLPVPFADSGVKVEASDSEVSVAGLVQQNEKPRSGIQVDIEDSVEGGKLSDVQSPEKENKTLEKIQNKDNKVEAKSSRERRRSDDDGRRRDEKSKGNDRDGKMDESTKPRRDSREDERRTRYSNRHGRDNDGGDYRDRMHDRRGRGGRRVDEKKREWHDDERDRFSRWKRGRERSPRPRSPIRQERDRNYSNWRVEHESKDKDYREERKPEKSALWRGQNERSPNQKDVARPVKNITKRDRDYRDNREATPQVFDKNECGTSAAKRQRSDSDEKPADESSEPEIEKLCDLFGKEDKDYRQVAVPPNDVDHRVGYFRSGSHSGWAKFKADHPDEFSFEIKQEQNLQAMDVDERLGKVDELTKDVDMRRIAPQTVPMLFANRIMLPEAELQIPESLGRDKQENILREAAKLVQAGKMSHEDHQSVLKQLGQLQQIQMLKQQSDSVQKDTSGTGYSQDLILLDFDHRPARQSDDVRNDENMPPDCKWVQQSGERRARSRSPLNRTLLRDPPRNQNMKSHIPSLLDRNQDLHSQIQGEDVDLRARPEMSGNSGRMPLRLPMGQRPLPMHGLRTNEGTPWQGPFVNNRDYPLCDPRWKGVVGMLGTDLKEEVVIDDKSYEIILGGKVRKIRLYGQLLEVYADPQSRSILINGEISYRFGELVNELQINGKWHRVFYQGHPKLMWIDQQQYEIRVDAPPRKIFIIGKEHGVQIDGRDMMILVDRLEKGVYGGGPREMIIDNFHYEVRFDPPPRQILIDGKSCELKLNYKVPFVVCDGRARGIRFDGPPREIIIDHISYLVPVDTSVRVRIGKRPHIIAFGGPAHEVIIDGKWFEVKFDGPPVEVSLGNRTHLVQLKGAAPQVKILGDIPAEMPFVKDSLPFSFPSNFPLHVSEPLIGGEFGLQRKADFPHVRWEHPRARSNRFPIPPRHFGHSRMDGPIPHPGQPDQMPMHTPRSTPERLAGPRPPSHSLGDFIGSSMQFPVPSSEKLPGRFPNPMLDPSMQQGQSHLNSDVCPPNKFISSLPVVTQAVTQADSLAASAASVGMMSNAPQGLPFVPSFTCQPMSRVDSMGPAPGNFSLSPAQRNMPPASDQETTHATISAAATNVSGVLASQANQSASGIITVSQGNQTIPGLGMLPVTQTDQSALENSTLASGVMYTNAGSVDTVSATVSGPQLTLPLNYLPLSIPAFLQGQPNQTSVLPSVLTNLMQPVASQVNKHLDVNTLFKKLVSAGIIPKSDSAKDDKKEEEKPKEKAENKMVEDEVVPDLRDFKSDKLKRRYNSIIKDLYSGVQCSSCGTRFIVEDTEKYREHLDWHFRQNKREKDDIKVPKYRKWYYEISEWIQYEEIQDDEEKARSNYFENLLHPIQEPLLVGPQGNKVIRCPAATGNEADDICEICSDPFEQYFDEEEEEWHLRNAVRVEGKTYHPVCYEDVKEAQSVESSPVDAPQTNPLDVSLQESAVVVKQEAGETSASTSVVVKQEPVDNTAKGSGTTNIKPLDPPTLKPVKVKTEPGASCKLKEENTLEDGEIVSSENEEK